TTAASLIYVTNNNGLAYTGLPASSGNQIALRNVTAYGSKLRTGNFAASANTTLYYSFLLKAANIAALSTSGDYNFGFNVASGTSAATPAASTIGAKLYLQKSGTGYFMGIAKRDTPSFDS